MTEPAGTTTMRRDIASAYVVSAARVLSWVVVSAIVFRLLGAGPFAVLALVKATIAILNYATLGLAPAIVHYVTAAAHKHPVSPVISAPTNSGTLEYASPSKPDPIQVVYSNALAVAWVTAAVVFGGFVVWASTGNWTVTGFAVSMAFGTLLRLASDPSGAILQARGRIHVDNALLAATEAIWVAATIFFVITGGGSFILDDVALSYNIGSGALFFSRLFLARRETGIGSPNLEHLGFREMRRLLSFGLIVVAAQLADYLYAPTDYLLIDALLGRHLVAVYAPAVQIDGALLLTVSGLAAVLLPWTAIAHAREDAATVRRYYVRGTVASGAILTSAALVVWFLSRWVFRLWLGDPMPDTQAILPLVLIHTVVGGSGAVGRSILLGIGKVKPFTISVLAAGLANVILSYVFVRHFDLGLRGIVFGTIIVVVARAGIWMPWYVLKTLRKLEPAGPFWPAAIPPPPAVN